MKNRVSSFENIRAAQKFNVGRIYSKEHGKNISAGKRNCKKHFSNEELQKIKSGVQKAIREGRYHKNKIPKIEYDNIKSLYLSGSINKRQLAFKYGIQPPSMQKLLQRIGV